MSSLSGVASAARAEAGAALPPDKGAGGGPGSKNAEGRCPPNEKCLLLSRAFWSSGASASKPPSALWRCAGTGLVEGLAKVKLRPAGEESCAPAAVCIPAAFAVAAFAAPGLEADAELRWLHMGATSKSSAPGRTLLGLATFGGTTPSLVPSERTLSKPPPGGGNGVGIHASMSGSPELSSRLSIFSQLSTTSPGLWLGSDKRLWLKPCGSCKMLSAPKADGSSASGSASAPDAESELVASAPVP
mmetsp:Transcript_98369/g.278179  ORF Transcript_98369/g.278179 Transcript_98369/m.278179 type:complete len:245 (+) Transcript_98369:776-1510(+)